MKQFSLEINECVENAPACGPNERCENTQGDFRCYCDGQYGMFEDGCKCKLSDC